MEECLSCLNRVLDEGLSPDMACEELRTAVEAISKITGHIDVEEVLDVLLRSLGSYGCQ